MSESFGMAEGFLATVLRVRPDLLTPAQHDLALTQHNCRMRRGSKNVCLAIAFLENGTHQACAECMVTTYVDRQNKRLNGGQ